MTKNIINTTVLVLFDSAALTLSLFISHGERLWLDRFSTFGDYDADIKRYAFSGLLYLLLLFLFYLYGLYNRRNDFWEESRIILQSVFFLFIFIATYVFVTKTSLEYSRAMVVLVFINMAWLLPIGRVASKHLLSRLRTWQVNAYIEGDRHQAEKLRYDLMANWFLGYRPVNSLKKAKIVFIATKNMPVEKLEKLIASYKKRMSEVVLIPYLSNISFANAEIVDLRIGRISMVNIQNQLFKTKNRILKKIAETLTVILLMPLFLIIFVLIAIWIKTDRRGPVLFCQKRLGENGSIFECYKFRTMIEENEAVLKKYLEKNPDEAEYYAKYHKYRNDPRLTKAGRLLRKLSLDELPQMINILKNEMSLIGPRPYMLSEKEKMGNAVETILHVKPGITGFWQIKGRNDLDFEERIELDNWYIQNWSLWLDFIIFIKTFEVLVTRRGAK